ncbi:MAG: B12-binding domain-containing protein, partial [Actinomycetota bacterium]
MSDDPTLSGDPADQTAGADDELDEIDLATLPDDELVPQMHDDLYDGLKEEIAEGTTILLDRGWGADKVLNEALVAAMKVVGDDFRDGILFVPEVLLAANAMKAG